MAGHEVGVFGAIEPRILLLEHVGAGRARHHDVPPLSHLFSERLHVVADEGLGLLHRAPVEVRHAAAALGGQRDVHPVSLEHGHRRFARRGIVEVDAAGHEEGHPGLRVKGRGLPPVEPGGEGLPDGSAEAGDLLVVCPPRPAWSALRRKRGRPVGEGRGQATQLPTSSVFPRKRSWRVTPLARASAERERSISRGKSTCQRCGGV